MKNALLAFLKGILAGLSIGLGGFLYVLMVWLIEGEIGKILGSLLFAVGLFTVCTFSLSLYTGKIGLVFEKKQDKDFYIALPIMYLGNAIGAFGLGYLCFAIFHQNESIMAAIQSICVSRTAFADVGSYFSCIIKSFLCGLCVYLAVKSFAFDRLKPVGICLLVLFVFIFVYCGFQHCIANMFYFGFGNHIQGYTFLNLAFVTLFNSFGPLPGVFLIRLFSKSR